MMGEITGQMASLQKFSVEKMETLSEKYDKNQNNLEEVLNRFKKLGKILVNKPIDIDMK